MPPTFLEFQRHKHLCSTVVQLTPLATTQSSETRCHLFSVCCIVKTSL